VVDLKSSVAAARRPVKSRCHFCLWWELVRILPRCISIVILISAICYYCPRGSNGSYRFYRSFYSVSM